MIVSCSLMQEREAHGATHAPQKSWRPHGRHAQIACEVQTEVATARGRTGLELSAQFVYIVHRREFVSFFSLFAFFSLSKWREKHTKDY